MLQDLLYRLWKILNRLDPFTPKEDLSLIQDIEQKSQFQLLSAERVKPQSHCQVSSSRFYNGSLHHVVSTSGPVLGFTRFLLCFTNHVSLCI